MAKKNQIVKEFVYTLFVDPSQNGRFDSLGRCLEEATRVSKENPGRSVDIEMQGFDGKKFFQIALVTIKDGHEE